jgi:hypothetical protein
MLQTTNFRGIFMLSQFFYLVLIGLVCLAPALATPARAPELDSSTLTAIAAAVTGCFGAFRTYQARKK